MAARPVRQSTSRARNFFENDIRCLPFAWLEATISRPSDKARQWTRHGAATRLRTAASLTACRQAWFGKPHRPDR
jgi:hypothetical protein